MARHLVRVGIAMFVLAAMSACGYTLAGRGNALPATIKTIGVPAFVNQTSVVDIDRIVTDAVRTELQNRGKYLVQPDSTGVDAVLTGTITRVDLVPSAFDQNRQATAYNIVVTVSGQFKDLADDRVIWSNPSKQATEDYPVSTGSKLDAAALLNQNAPALDRLSKDLAKSIVTEIFQAF